MTAKWISKFQWISIGMIALILNTFNSPVRVYGKTAVLDGPAARRSALMSEYTRTIAGLTDREAFARLAERSAQMSGQNAGRFLDDLSSVVMGVQSSLLGIPWSLAGRGLEALKIKTGLTGGYPALLRFGSAGFRFDDKSNQVQHFWFSVLLSYHFGARLAELAARYHEWNAPGLLDLLPGSGHGRGSAGDLALSRQGILLGRALAEGHLRPGQVPGWLRENL